jgi:hypothetical protein
MFRSILLSTLFLTFSLTINAQTKYLNKAEDTKKFAEGIAASIATGNMPGATKELRQVMISSPADFDLFEAQLATQAGTFLAQIGSPKSYEFISENRLGASLIRQQLLVLHEKAPLRINIVFYKSEKGWVVTHFYFDTNTLNFFL